MKNKNFIISIMCVVVVVAIVVAAIIFGRKANNNEVTTLAPTVSQSEVSQSSVAGKEDVDVDDIHVLRKSVLVDGDDFKMVIILENTSKVDAAVAVVGKVYDEKKRIIGTERESVFLDPTAQSVVVLDFDTEGTRVDDEDFKLSAAKASTIKPGIKNIASENTVNGKEVSATSTNNNTFDLEGVEAYCLFFRDNQLVDVESEDVENEATEIFEKATSQKQSFVTNSTFESVKIYYTQSQDEDED